MSTSTCDAITAPEAVVWDARGAHTAKLLNDLLVARVRLPPYSPELNPAERVFQEVRRQLEEQVYASVAAKQAAPEGYLRALATDPARVRRLGGWAGSPRPSTPFRHPHDRSV